MTPTRILIIDDEHIFAKNMAKLLSHRGYNTKYVLRGSEAIALIEAEHFDIILLDLQMPGLDGVDTLKQVLLRDPVLRVILLTGYGSMGVVQQALDLGACSYLRKPCEIEELLEVVQKIASQ